LVGNSVAHIDGGTKAEGIREQGAEEDIGAKERRDNRGVKKTA